MNFFGEWNIYDIIWIVFCFNEDGMFKLLVYMMVLYNGVVILNYFEFKGDILYYCLLVYIKYVDCLLI